MHHSKLFFVLFILITVYSCENSTSNNTEQKHEYLIKAFDDFDTVDVDWFKVIEIHTNQYQTVPAVKELEGNYYLPIMSRPPTFEKKIVEGEFYMDQVYGTNKPDTVFRVTKHVRDSTVSTHSL